MFEIAIGDLLASFAGDSKELRFMWPIYAGYFDDLECVWDVELHVKLIGTDEGITVMLQKLKAKIVHEGQTHDVELKNVEREFREKFDLNNPDDIKYINAKNATIDLKDVLREELIIATLFE